MNYDVACELGGLLINPAFTELTLGYVSFVFSDTQPTRDFALFHIRWIYKKYLRIEVFGLTYEKDLRNA